MDVVEEGSVPVTFAGPIFLLVAYGTLHPLLESHGVDGLGFFEGGSFVGWEALIVAVESRSSIAES
jgi:hypothetical protein